MIAILGATGTIGSTLARRLVDQGYPVILIARNAEKLGALADELQQPMIEGDASDSSVLEEKVKAHLARGDASSGDGASNATGPHGSLTGIANCIGSVLLKSAHTTSDEEFRQTFETNLFSSFACVKLAGRLMKENGGSVVLFASAAAEIGIANHEAIAAAKAGIIGLARSAAATYAASNIRFNVVSPGLVKTELTRRLWQNEVSAKASCQMHALGRLGEPSQVASLTAWLLDPANDWITGQVIGIDGGLGHVLSRR